MKDFIRLFDSIFFLTFIINIRESHIPDEISYDVIS